MLIGDGFLSQSWVQEVCNNIIYYFIQKIRLNYRANSEGEMTWMKRHFLSAGFEVQQTAGDQSLYLFYYMRKHAVFG